MINKFLILVIVSINFSCKNDIVEFKIINCEKNFNNSYLHEVEVSNYLDYDIQFFTGYVDSFNFLSIGMLKYACNNKSENSFCYRYSNNKVFVKSNEKVRLYLLEKIDFTICENHEISTTLNLVINEDEIDTYYPKIKFVNNIFIWRPNKINKQK